MDARQPSRTADGAAIMRALHQQLPAETRVLDEPIAAMLVDTLSDAFRARVSLVAQLPETARLRLTNFVLRSRVAEDCLAQAAQPGIVQYVMLGAGLDTFAYRQPSWARRLRIFEVDHPATQDMKKSRLRGAGIFIPTALGNRSGSMPSSSKSQTRGGGTDAGGGVAARGAVVVARGEFRQLGRCRADIGAGPFARFHEALGGKSGMGEQHRVARHAELLAERARARQPGAGLQAPGGDRRADLPDQLVLRRDWRRRVDVEGKLHVGLRPDGKALPVRPAGRTVAVPTVVSTSATAHGKHRWMPADLDRREKLEAKALIERDVGRMR